MSISGIAGLPAQVTDYLAEMKKVGEELFAGPDMAGLTAVLQADVVDISSQALTRSQNMLSRNFVGGHPEDAAYLDARMAGAAAVGSLQNSMNSSLGAVMGGLAEAAMWHGDSKMRRAKMMKDALEAHAEVFADIKSGVGESAATRGENGEPATQAAAMPAAGSGGAPAEQAPAPDIDIKAAATAARALSSITLNV